MRRTVSCQWSVVSVALLAASVWAAPRQAMPQAVRPATPWRVQAQVTVAARVVRLGDLVGPALPDGLAQLVLSAAPQPGMPLRWSRTQLAARLRSAGMQPDRFAIPERIEIRRQARPIPEAVVLKALNASLHRSLTAGDVRYTSPLTTAADPEIKILRAVPDLMHGQLEVFCRAQHDPQLLPFAVSVRVPRKELARRQRRAWLQPPAPAKPILVKPGHTAQLVIAAPGFALTTRVQPLQAGRQGDHIRVRSLATKAILQVLVTGHDQVSSLGEGGGHGRR